MYIFIRQDEQKNTFHNVCTLIKRESQSFSASFIYDVNIIQYVNGISQ